jgi:hypothetical protein
MSGGPRPQVLAVCEVHDRFEALDLGDRDAAAARGQAVVLPPLIVQRGIGPFVGFGDEAVGGGALDERVQRARPEPDLPVAAPGDFLEDRVACRPIVS